MSYVTWEYYSTHFSAVQDETEFDRLAHTASQKIDVLTARRAASAEGYKADAVRECACHLIDYLHGIAGTAQGQGIASVSNDGYTESYQAQTAGQAEDNLRDTAFAWLSGTGLMGAL